MCVAMLDIITRHVERSLHFPFSACRAKGTLQWTPKVDDTKGGIRNGPFAVHENYFCKMNFHFINWPHAAFPFPAYSEMDTPQCTPKVNGTKGHMTLGHSSWTLGSRGCGGQSCRVYRRGRNKIDYSSVAFSILLNLDTFTTDAPCRLKGQRRPGGGPDDRVGPVGRGGGQQQGHHQGHPGQGAVHLGGLRKTLQVGSNEVLP